MANLSDLSRKDQVFKVLHDHLGMWIDGTALANEQVGGSEGLKRLRELRIDLRAEGKYAIQQRQHPEPGRSIYQYRLVEQTRAFTPAGQPAWTPPRQEVPLGNSARRSDPQPDRPPQPAQSSWTDPNPYEADTAWHDWKPAKKARGTLEHIFWIGKQRVIGAIAPLGDDRWGWGVLVPANKTRMTPEKRAGHGTAATRDAARDAVESCIRRMRETGEYR